jgi:hypothetical protein
VALVALGLLSATSAGRTAPAIFTIPIGLLVAVVLPGYTFSVALFPTLDRPARLLYTLGLNMCALILGGLVLNLLPWGLQPLSWAGWLTLIIFASSIAGWMRRRAPQSYLVSQRQIELSRGSMALIAVGTLLLVLAFTFALYTDHQSDEPFTQLWAIPMNTPESRGFEVGIRNQTEHTAYYNLTVESGGRRIQEWRALKLEPDAEWVQPITLPDVPTSPIIAYLYLADAPDIIHRTVQIAPEAFSNTSQQPVGAP